VGTFFGRHHLDRITLLFQFRTTEYFKEADGFAKADAIQKLVPRALWWFRWGAVLTLITGLGIFGSEAVECPWIFM